MRFILKILFISFLTIQAKSQLLYYQNSYKGGISYDGRSYQSFDYLQADSIVFQNIIPASSILKKALLISQRINSIDISAPHIPDTPLKLIFNGTSFFIDSSDIVTNYFNCDYSNPSGSLSTVVKDVTAFAMNNNNTLITPCQACNTLFGQAVYDGFYLVLLYSDNNMPTVNTAIFLNNQSDYTTMIHNFSSLNPINTTYDVGLSITNNCASKLFNYQCSYNLYNGANTYTLGTIYSSTDSGMNKLPGSFYYQNNILHGLVDDSNSPVIDSTDALANIKTYLPNGTTTFSLTSIGNVSGACDDERVLYVLAFSTPCPARSAKDSTFVYPPICTGQNIQLLGSSIGSYTWSAPTGNSLSSYTISNPIASPTITTTYVALVDSNGCKHTEQHQVFVHTSPKTDSVKTTIGICGSLGGSANIIATIGSPSIYTLNGISQSNSLFTNLAAGTYTFSLSNLFGCTYRSSKSFTIRDTNMAFSKFSIDQITGCEPLQVTCKNLSNFFNTVTNSYVWYINGDSTTTTDLNYTLIDTGLYTITLFSYETLRNCGAVSSRTVSVKYCPPDSIKITVPNVFTPDGDGINDTWQLIIYNYNYTISNYQCAIYDRWGIKVFDSSNISEAWTGKSTSGLSCSAGSYYYLIKVTVTNANGSSEGKEFKGFLELIR